MMAYSRQTSRLPLLFALPALILGLAFEVSGFAFYEVFKNHFLTFAGVVTVLTPEGASLSLYILGGLVVGGLLLLGCALFILYGFTGSGGLRARARRFGMTLTMCAICAVFLASGVVVPAANATISSNPTAIVSAYSCEKGPSFLITVDNAATPNYYAIATSGTATTPCGTLVYGGSGNAGGATGINATATAQAAVNKGGTIVFGPGTFTFTANTPKGILTIPSNTTLEGQGIDITTFVLPDQTINHAPCMLVNANPGTAGQTTNSNTNIDILGLTISGNAGTSSTSQIDSGCGIIFIGVNGFKIDSVKIKGVAGTAVEISHVVASGGIYKASANPAYSRNGIISNCILLSTRGGAITTGNVLGVSVTDNYMSAGDTPIGVSTNKRVVNSTTFSYNTIDELGNNGEQVPILAGNSPMVELAASYTNATVVFGPGNLVNGPTDPLVTIEQSFTNASANMNVIGNILEGPYQPHAGHAGGRGVIVQPTELGSAQITDNRMYRLLTAVDCEHPCSAIGNYIEATWGPGISVDGYNVVAEDNTCNHVTIDGDGNLGCVSLAEDGSSTFTAGNATIIGNNCEDTYSTETSKACVTADTADGGTDAGNNLVMGNTAKASTRGLPSGEIFGFGAKGDTVVNNFPFNPYGQVTSNFLIGGRSSVTSHLIGLLPIGGNSTTEVASVTYTWVGGNCYITSANSANSNNAITVKDKAGNTLVNAVSTLSWQPIFVGWTITWGAFTGAAGAASVYCN